MKHLIKALILTLCLCSLSLATPTTPSKIVFDIEISSDPTTLNQDNGIDVVDEDQSTKAWIADKAQEMLNEVRTLLTLPEAQPTLKIDRAAEKQELKSDEKKLEKLIEAAEEQPKKHERSKRQLAIGGGFGLGFGAYDYNDYYGDYVGDYAYDYYDWICTDTACQLCDILTSECCDPDIDINCYLPDSCINNPCLSGGTCISSKTIDGRPDFVCACLPGLTGKYCQLANDYFVGAEAALAGSPAIPRPGFAPGGFPVVSPTAGGGLPYGGGAYGGYAAPAAAPMSSYGGYAAPAASGGYAAPAQAAAPYGGGYGTQSLAFSSFDGFPRMKRSLEDDMENFVQEYQKLLMTLGDDSSFRFSCNSMGKGEERHVLWENGTKTSEVYCQCYDKSFGTNCNKSTKVNCLDDSSRRTSAGHYVPRQYYIECTGHMPNVIKCSEGKIYDKEQKQCIKHSLKKQEML